MSQFDNLRDKASDYAKDNPEKTEKYSDTGVEKGGDAFDKVTGGKFDEHTDKAQSAADDRIGDDKASGDQA